MINLHCTVVFTFINKRNEKDSISPSVRCKIDIPPNHPSQSHPFFSSTPPAPTPLPLPPRSSCSSSSSSSSSPAPPPAPLPPPLPDPLPPPPPLLPPPALLLPSSPPAPPLFLSLPLFLILCLPLLLLLFFLPLPSCSPPFFYRIFVLAVRYFLSTTKINKLFQPSTKVRSISLTPPPPPTPGPLLLYVISAKT